MADSYIMNEVYPYVEKSFSDKNNINKYSRIIGSFIDKNHELLSDIGPSKIILFTDYEKNQVYNLLDISPKIVKDAKNKSKDIKSTGLNLADPFKPLMSMIVRYFSLKKDEKMTKMSVFYLGCALYPSLFTKYWKFAPNEKVMQYTINNLSNKYKIKQLGSLMATIDDLCWGAYLLHKDGLEKGSDKSVVDFVLSMQTRLNSFLKQLANEWYQNYQSGNYLENEFESSDDDNFREADSTAHVIERIVDKVSLKLVIEGPPMKIITIAANSNKVSVNELRNYITSMVVQKNIEEVKSIIEAILTLFLYDEQNSSKDINSDKFLFHCIDTYKRSNTTNESVIVIKKILDVWLDRVEIYKKTQRPGTINDFRRAIYMFFVMAIQYYN